MASVVPLVYDRLVQRLHADDVRWIFALREASVQVTMAHWSIAKL